MKIYRYIVAFVLGLNGAMLVAIGIRMITTVDERISQFGLNVSQSTNLAPTMHALGVSDAVVSIFSFVAMILVLKGHAAGRGLSFVVGAHQLITGVAIYLLTSGLFGLFFITSRGVVIIALTWPLRTDESMRPG